MHIYLAQPRGFCAGVDRAISIVNFALEKFQAPVYAMKLFTITMLSKN